MSHAKERIDEVELLVCATCKREGWEGGEDAIRPGADLVARLGQEPLPEGVRLRSVECLSNCSRGCTIALRGPDRWTYVYGNLDPAEHAETVREGVALYRAAPEGLVPWRERPEHFKRNCIARIPPIGALDD